MRPESTAEAVTVRGGYPVGTDVSTGPPWGRARPGPGVTSGQNLRVSESVPFPMAQNGDSPTALTETDREALHAAELGVEHVFRAYGDLLGCHHRTGHAMEKFEKAEALLREAGHEEFADDLRDRLLPTGAVEDAWTYELVEAFRDGFVDEVESFEVSLREELADGRHHVAERDQQRRWRERARSDDWRDESAERR